MSNADYDKRLVEAAEQAYKNHDDCLYDDAGFFTVGGIMRMQRACFKAGAAWARANPAPELSEVVKWSGEVCGFLRKVFGTLDKSKDELALIANELDKALEAFRKAGGK